MRQIALLALLIALILPTAIVSAAAPAPTLTVTSPAGRATISGADVEVVFQAGNFAIVPSKISLAEYGKRPDANRPNEGHLHLTLDLGQLVVWDKDAPYTFRNVPAGEHQLTVELANNDHSSLNPPVVQTVAFTTVASTAQTAPSASMPMQMPNTGANERGPWLALLGVSVLLAGLGTALVAKRVR